MLNPRAGLISVIIPTLRRPDLVQRAVSSVLSQTHTNLELIVVIDGPDPETLAALQQLSDPRIRILQNAISLGPGKARNYAAAEARGESIAFLDDDDAWFPEKLSLQLAAARSASQPIDGSAKVEVLVSCRARVNTPRAVYVWPRSVYDGMRPVDEYMYDRRSLFQGDAFIQTSTYFMSTTLFARAKFGESRHHEDMTLLLRATKLCGARVIMLPDTLVEVYREEQREALGEAYDWQTMLAWLDSMGELITPRAYSGFCLIYLGSQAARNQDFLGFRTLLGRSLRRGRPTLTQMAIFLSFWILPIELRRAIRARLSATSFKPRPVRKSAAH